jgi:hypothetical protein
MEPHPFVPYSSVPAAPVVWPASLRRRSRIPVVTTMVGSLTGLLLGAPVEMARAEQAVDLELVLAVDCSGSVDQAEFELQMQGIASAFRDPEVVRALEAHAPRGVAVALVQWAGRKQEELVVKWTLLIDAGSAEDFAGRVVGAPRWMVGETAIADAIDFAAAQLRHNLFAAARRVVDVSGDGVTNSGRDPDVARDAAVAEGVTVNGLAILNEEPELDLYYRRHVIGGPGAFVVAAADYGDFARAMRQKLLREIEGAPLAALPSRPGLLEASAGSLADRTPGRQDRL